jgi:hypothetical protein
MSNILNVQNINQKTRNILLTTLLILMLTTSLVSAAGEDATVFVTRLTGTYIGIKIVFPEPINGDFAGVIHGNHFSCLTVPPDTLYCIGQLASWVDAATLHIYEHPSGEIVFSNVISSPPRIGGGEVTPSEPEPESEECPPGECEFNSPQ